MNLNNNATRILCFGDSNTWGSIPGKSQRFPTAERWTGVLQKLLGEDYEIIEEGLSARTTTIDDIDHPQELRNGARYLVPCLNSHIPLDYVILFLGTNDLKERYHRKAEQVAEGIEELINLIKNMKYIHETVPPNIILLAPPIMDDNEESLRGKYFGADLKFRQLGQLYGNLASKYQIPFINLRKVFPPMGHLDSEAHQKLANILAEKIIEISTKKV